VPRLTILLIAVFVILGAGFVVPPQHSMAAEKPEFTIIIKNHRFEPEVLYVPAGVKIKLIVINQDPTPEEFESYELNREKIIGGGRKAIIYIGPLKPGEYPFFGEFNMDTALGKIIAE
jgi:hypothetical protein